MVLSKQPPRQIQSVVNIIQRPANDIYATGIFDYLFNILLVWRQLPAIGFKLYCQKLTLGENPETVRKAPGPHNPAWVWPGNDIKYLKQFDGGSFESCFRGLFHVHHRKVPPRTGGQFRPPGG